uniref:TonB-dependent receptor n=1 Tax=Flavobacterium sp. TaxID=239 RepID=UPI00404988FC
MTNKNLVWLCLVFCCLQLAAQNDSIFHLEEVIVADTQLKNVTKTQSLITLKQEDLEKHLGSFTQLLNTNSGLYFKENGAGMVSSVSFRGTSAQQTSVVWNGIPINSQLNGQTDFNTFSSNDFSSVNIKSGGGSVLYGSGAIGGSIHLTNEVAFNKKSRFYNRTHYGSFNAQSGHLKWQMGSKKWAYNLGINRQQSDNDYPYLETELKNENGRFYNQSVNATISHQINDRNVLTFYNHFYDSQRDFSGTLSMRSQNQYIDWNTRSMLEWVNQKDQFEFKLKYAYLTEKYFFYENKYTPQYNFGQAKTNFIRQESIWKFSEKTKWTAQFEFHKNTGKGSNFEENSRKTSSVSLLWEQKFNNHWFAEGSVRWEQNDLYETPFLYAFAGRWQKNKTWAMKSSLSKNFRIPSFNDLYWQGSGNTDLKPETALQFEIGPEFKTKNWTISAQYFSIHLENLLRWVPNSSGNWSPENTSKVRNQGLEFLSSFQKKWGNHQFECIANYTFTEALDLKKNSQLIYVPYHKANATIKHQYRKLGVFLQTMYQGNVFTSSDNAYELPAYLLTNSGVDYLFETQKINYKLGFQIHNIFNKNYQNVIARPMPGRNFQISLTLTL